MIKSSMRIKLGRFGIDFNRIVHTEGSDEQICMDLRTLGYGIQERIKKEAKNKEDEVEFRTMYEVAFFEGLRMREKEVGDMDQEFYDQFLQRLLDSEVDDEEEIKGFSIAHDQC